MEFRMKELSEAEIYLVSGGLDLSGLEPTRNAVNRTLQGYINRYGLVVGPHLWVQREWL